MSDGPVCGRCRTYLPGEPRRLLCAACIDAVAAEARVAMREAFLQQIARGVAQRSAEVRP